MRKTTAGLMALAIWVAWLAGATDARAVFVDRILLNHPDGNAGGDYILRIDLPGESPQTFNGEAGGAFVTLSLDPTTNIGQISGTVLHNQSVSGDLWSITADLGVQKITQADGSPWNTTDGSGNLYDEILSDMETNAASSNGLDENHLKNELLPADRLAFEIVQLEMTFLGVGTPDFIIPGQTPGTVTLNQYPSGSDDDMLPFMIAKGHRIGTGAATDPLTGFGWLRIAGNS